MSGINDKVISQSFADDRATPGVEQDFEIDAAGSAPVGNEFDGDIQEGQFDQVTPARRGVTGKVMAAGLVGLALAGGAYFFASQQEQKRVTPDFAAMKQALPPSPAPAVQPVEPVPLAQNGSPEAAPGSGEQVLPVGQVAVGTAPSSASGSENTSVAPAAPPVAQPSMVTVAPTTSNPLTPVSMRPQPSAAPIVAAAPPSPKPEVKVAAPVQKQPAPPAAAKEPVQPQPKKAKPVKAQVVSAGKDAAGEVAPPRSSASAAVEPRPRPPVIKVETKPIPSETGSIAPARNSDDRPLANDVRPLVTVTAEQIGLRALTSDSLMVVTGSGQQRFRIGDYLPSGERITFIDSPASTIVTDQKIIRVVN